MIQKKTRMCKEHDDRNLTTNLILPVVKALNVVHFHLLNVLLSFFVLYILLNQYVQFFPLYKPSFYLKRKKTNNISTRFNINNMTFLDDYLIIIIHPKSKILIFKIDISILFFNFKKSISVYQTC
jgi:hypothetical protein